MRFVWRAFGATALGLIFGCQRPAGMGAAWPPGHPGPADASVADARATSAGALSVRPGSADAATAAAAAIRVAAAGDIACDGCGQAGTAALIDQLISTDHLQAVLVLGDLAYSSGSAAEFQAFYAPSWGRPEILQLSHPVPGNHEYASGSADDYFDYFNGAAAPDGQAGPRGQGYYSFDLGSWHVIALNSSDACRFVSCSDTSAQRDWLAADLAAHPALCTLAFWHHPRFQAGTSSGELSAVAPLWNLLYAAGVELVLNGHEHGYQQLSPLDDTGQLDPARGIRTFVVGTGGGEFDTSFGGPRLGALETSVTGSTGVLELTLQPGGYSWQFVETDGTRPSAASGSAPCH